MRPPAFWNRPPGLWASLLSPLGWIYDAGTAARLRLGRPRDVGVPVICVGNLVAGGAGKTPVALALGRLLAARGHPVHFLSRGYRGRTVGPCRVDPARHDAATVGDEPLLLARAAPTWVARDRAAGAAAAVAAGARLIVMDDGFQNPAVVRRLGLVVVDGAVGFGNRRVMPAGPLREALGRGLARADAVVVVGEDRAGVGELVAAAGRPLIRGRLDPVAVVPAGGPGIADGPLPSLAGRPVLAFAGIGRPGKLFETLSSLGADLIGRYSFSDHHPYQESDLLPLLARAGTLGALVITTSKDAVRLPPALRSQILVLDVSIRWDNPKHIEDIMEFACIGVPLL